MEQSKDVEMKEVKPAAAEEEKKEAEPADPFFGKITPLATNYLEFKKVMILLEKAGKEKDMKLAGSLTK